MTEDYPLVALWTHTEVKSIHHLRVMSILNILQYKMLPTPSNRPNFIEVGVAENFNNDFTNYLNDCILK